MPGDQRGDAPSGRRAAPKGDPNSRLLSPSVAPSSSASSVYSASPSSRPVSMLSPARAATPSSSHATVSFVGSHRTQIDDRTSLSPSNSNATTTGPGAAMSRLKRVASNASVASLIAQRKQTPLGGGGGGGGNGGDGSSSRAVSVIESPSPKPQQEQEEVEAPKHLEPGTGQDEEDNGGQGLTVKRRRPGEGQASVNKAARRRTWFGFAPMESDNADSSTESGEQSRGIESEAKAPSAVEEAMPPAEEAQASSSRQPTEDAIHEHQQGTLKANAEASRPPARGWIPWRGPTSAPQAPREDSMQTSPPPPANQPQGSQNGLPLDGKSGSPSEPSAAPVPPPNAAEPALASYTGTIRRLWSGAEGVASSSGLGWPVWGRGADAQPNGDAMDTSADGEPTKASDHQPQSANQGEAANGEAASKDVEMAEPPPKDSFVYRWLPSWGSRPPTSAEESQKPGETEAKQVVGDGQEEERRPTAKTPAEQVKEEALSRMSATGSGGTLSAREAVLNPATRSMWVNYFGSRAARPPPRLESGHEGPEVMKIDFPSAEPPRESKKEELVPQRQTKADNSREVSPKASSSNLKALGALKTTNEPAPAGKDQKQNGTSDSEPERLPVNKPDPAAPASRPSTPLTGNKDLARKVTKAAAATAAAHKQRDPSSSSQQPPKPKQPPPPNLILPTFEDVFTRPPRSLPPSVGVLERTLSAVNSYLFSTPPDPNRIRTKPAHSRHRKVSLLSLGGRSATDGGNANGRGGEEAHEYAMAEEAEQRLPRLWSVMGDKDKASTRGCRGVHKVAVIGVHGWFSKGPLRNVFGEPTGTSTKFSSMMAAAVHKHFRDAGAALQDEDISVIALEGDGRVSERVDKLFAALLGNQKHVQAIAEADALFIAAHSQGSIVATHLLARLIEQGHVNARKTRTALLAMCGIHHGPFPHLSTNTISSYYLNTFETPAAKELFEFQTSSTSVSQQYQAALKIIIGAGVKLIYVASLDDQVVPLYSALHSSVSHPSILRALYCDGQAFPRVDFLTNLLSFCVAVRNAGLTDHGLLTLLSASVAGSLYGGLGHSLVYEEANTYSLAVRYLFEVTSPRAEPCTKPSEGGPPAIRAESFEAQRWNPYALPWSLRGLLEDPQVRDIFGQDIEKLLHDYTEWQPSTKTLKDVQFRLEPMRLVQQRRGTSTREHASASGTSTPSSSKL